MQGYCWSMPPIVPRVRILFASIALLAALVAGRAPADAEESPTAEAAATVDVAYQEALEKAEDIEDSLVKAVEKVRRSSVSVFQYRNMKGASEPVMAGCGSGVIVKEKGKYWILTNVHVIAGAHELRVVTSDGVERPVVVHDTIPSYDIALLRFSGRPPKVKGVVVKATTSERKLDEGTWVIATGNPFFLATDGASVTTLGVISGLDRYLGGRYEYVGAIQHDAEVNPGNSGGPLWNLKGDLAGINGKIMMAYRSGGAPTNTGASFSLPVHQVDEFLDRLVKDENAKAGFLGIETKTATDKKGNPIGAEVVRVHARSPVMGDRKRPKKGDVITVLTLKGRTKYVRTDTDIRRAISLYMADTPVKIRYKRNGRTQTWSGKLAAER